MVAAPIVAIFAGRYGRKDCKAAYDDILSRDPGINSRIPGRRDKTMFDEDKTIQPIHHGKVAELPPGYIVKIGGFPFALTATAYVDNSAGNLQLVHREDLFEPRCGSLK